MYSVVPHRWGCLYPRKTERRRFMVGQPPSSCGPHRTHTPPPVSAGISILWTTWSILIWCQTKHSRSAAHSYPLPLPLPSVLLLINAIHSDNITSPKSPSLTPPYPFFTSSLSQILMMDLDPHVLSQFSGSYDVDVYSTARELTTAVGLSDLIPGAIMDDKLFEPCGYSLNAIVKASKLLLQPNLR